MKVLLDTNIIIYREDDRVVADNIRDLFGLLNTIPVDIYVHPVSLQDVRHDSNQRRRDMILSKIRTYRELSNPPIAAKDPDFSILAGSSENPHDRIDDEILYAVRRDAVDFLITEDADIHRKAIAIGEKDRVFHVDDALHFFQKFLPPRERLTPPPSLKEEFMYNLNRDDPIFDTLKAEYPRFGTSPSFEEWFEKKALDHHKCYVSYMAPDRLGAILIKKIEDEEIEATPPIPRKKRLKIATMKVVDYGQKIGELLLRLSFESAVQNGCVEVYLTHFTQPGDRLIELIREYGFEKVAMNSRGEEVYLKKIVIDDPSVVADSPRTIYRTYYPTFYDGSAVKKWVIPTRPEYHQRLFTDFRRRQTTLPEHSGEFIVEGNAIKKAYLCNSRVRDMGEGDVVLFYRSRDESAITSIGVIEDVHVGISDPAQIMQIVGKRTVYSPTEIEGFKKPLTIILFRHVTHLATPLRIGQLQDMDILKAAPQSISNLSDEKYETIKALGGINGRYTIN
ncbi:MAG: hypothetical protein ABFC89_11555 [Methanospirillum sp.]